MGNPGGNPVVIPTHMTTEPNIWPRLQCLALLKSSHNVPPKIVMRAKDCEVPEKIVMILERL